MKITFYDARTRHTSDDFGCATVGFAGLDNAEAKKSFCHTPNGVLICGTYKECLDNIPDDNYKAGIVLTGNCGGENEFVDALSKKLGIPLVGGGAAIDEATKTKALLTGNSEVAVYLINDDAYEYEVLCENIHHDVLSEHKFSFEDSRTLIAIDGVEAATWLRNKKAELGLSPEDFEHLTFSDKDGFNVHLSEVDGVIHSGADLKPEMLLRYVPADKVDSRIHSFYADADSIIFGCAGLKGILSCQAETDGLGLFLYGEICTSNQKSNFSNLMLSKLRIKKK